MKIWTIQPWNVWLYLKKHGIYIAKENLSQLIYPNDFPKDENFEKPIIGWTNS